MTKSLLGESLEAATELIDVAHVEQCLGHRKPLVSISSYWFFHNFFSRSLFRSQATSEPAMIKNMYCSCLVLSILYCALKRSQIRCILKFPEFPVINAFLRYAFHLAFTALVPMVHTSSGHGLFCFMFAITWVRMELPPTVIPAISNLILLDLNPKAPLTCKACCKILGKEQANALPSFCWPHYSLTGNIFLSLCWPRCIFQGADVSHWPTFLSRLYPWGGQFVFELSLFAVIPWTCSRYSLLVFFSLCIFP